MAKILIKLRGLSLKVNEVLRNARGEKCHEVVCLSWKMLLAAWF